MAQPRSGKRRRVEWFAQTVDCDDAEAMAEFYAAILGDAPVGPARHQ